jgi:NDP-sugar pyrophosphorylase family protein
LNWVFERFTEYTEIVDRINVLPSSDSPRTVIGNDVWIGRNCTILTGVTIGDDAIIGANAVVTKDVENYTIVGGVHARFIRRRFDEKTISELLKLQWWDYDLKPLRSLLSYDKIGRSIEVLSALIGEGKAPLANHQRIAVENIGGNATFRLA